MTESGELLTPVFSKVICTGFRDNFTQLPQRYRVQNKGRWLIRECHRCPIWSFVEDSTLSLVRTHAKLSVEILGDWSWEGFSLGVNNRWFLFFRHWNGLGSVRVCEPWRYRVAKWGYLHFLSKSEFYISLLYVEKAIVGAQIILFLINHLIHRRLHI